MILVHCFFSVQEERVGCTPRTRGEKSIASLWTWISLIFPGTGAWLEKLNSHKDTLASCVHCTNQWFYEG